MTHRIPLLRDHHTHPLLYAAFMAGVDLGQEHSKAEAIRLIRERAKSTTSGWTIAYGWNSGRYALVATDFDDLPPLVVINVSIHGFLVNETGRALLQATDPVVAANMGDAEWLERNLRRVLNLFANQGASAERLQRFYQWLLEDHGVYFAEEMLLVDANEIRLFEQAGLTERTRFWAAADLYQELSPGQQARVHGIKLFTDGALGTRTAALHRPYRDSTQQGMLIYLEEELAAEIDKFNGKPLAIHAIGDRAIDQVVTVIERSRPTGPVRIEHAQLISRSTARRAKALGIHLCMQPNFSDDSVHYAERLPEGYAQVNNPFRMLIDEVGYVPGKDLLFGSDGMPHGVREGLRQSLFPRYDSQRLSLNEFVAGYCYPEMERGFIEIEIDDRRRRVACRIVLADNEGRESNSS